MKKKLFIVMLAVALMAGCGTKEEAENPEEKNKEPVKVEEQQKEEPEEEQKEVVTIYYIDGESEELKSEEVEVDKADEAAVWAELQKKGIVPEDAKVNALKQEANTLQLDVDAAFGDYFRRQGTTGENEIIKCIVNSYLDTFHCEKIMVTEDGGELTSSHMAYEGYLSKMK